MLCLLQGSTFVVGTDGLDSIVPLFEQDETSYIGIDYTVDGKYAVVWSNCNTLCMYMLVWYFMYLCSHVRLVDKSKYGH